MPFLKEQIGEIVAEAVREKFPSFDGGVKIEYPSDVSHGDYATPVCFDVARHLGKSLPHGEGAPRVIAQNLIKSLKIPSWISGVEPAGAGFINFFLSPEFLTNFPGEIISEASHFGESTGEKGKTVVTDSSHPNVAKPMGVHHLLSTIIGNSLNHIFAAVGYKVIRDNYLGDWGTQFGKLIYAYKTWGDPEVVKKNPIPELLKLYVKFHDEVEKELREKSASAQLEEAGRAEFKKLENGDSENHKLWEWIVDLSLREFEKIWARLDVTFDYIHGESFYEDKMQEIIDLGIKKKIFVTGDGGALIAPFTHEKYPPCIIRKSDGATLYATRDLARTKYWEDTWHPDLMVMVVDSAQSLHFKQFFEVAQMMKITDAPNIHISFGRMNFPEKRMSTRKGNMILLEELLDEAEELAYKIVSEKNPDLPEDAKKNVGKLVGIGGVKYAVLSQNRNTNITFTWDKILNLEGNSAPYIQYVYARGKSILRKAGQATRDKKYIFKEPQELAAARLLPKFPEVVALAAQEYKPNLIANYLFELASAFNSFYAAVPVLQGEAEAQQARLALVESITVVLKNGLKLLGIETLEEM